MRRIYARLPAEFCPPWWAAERIAAADTPAERLELFERIPEQWRELILHFAKTGIALRITALEDRVARQAALAQVPEAWREEVRAHVLRLWQTRALRATHAAEIAARREAESA